jgi:hypothetical protein
LVVLEKTETIFFLKEKEAMRKLLVLFFAILLISLSPAATFATEGNAEAKQAEYEALFDSQIKTLKSKGVSPQIIRMLSYQYYEVIEEASRTSVGDGNVAFLPVIPRSYLSVYDQMTMVESGGNKGYNYLRPSLIWDKVKTPDEPYWIFNVEDGEATRNKSPHDAEKILKNSERSPLTVAETVSLALHTRVLTRHFFFRALDATGSRYGTISKHTFSSYGVPSIWFNLIDNESRAQLGWVSIDRHSSTLRGSPSCESRFVIHD